MAIINLTPDSFSGDGLAGQTVAALRRAERALELGAAILDIGAESTRPGAAPVPASEEWARLKPVLSEVRDWPVAISLDSRKPAVMARALELGVDILNDVSGFGSQEAQQLAALSGCGLVVMHMQGEPATMQEAPSYQDVVQEVGAFLRNRTAELVAAGVERGRILWDVGFGFGKTLAHNVALWRALPRFAAEQPILVGVSRKSMLGALAGEPLAARRMPESIAAALAAVSLGAAVLRVHDLEATLKALAVWSVLAG